MIILLTGCIAPNGMLLTTLNDKDERKEQYIKSILFYLSKTQYPIVFVENSNTDISSFFQKYIDTGRLEIMTFDGNKDKMRGKGYGECEIIEYALNNSKMIKTNKNEKIAKITGRLSVRNINLIAKLHCFFFSYRTILFSINSDLSFPDSRIIIAPTAFYRLLLNKKEQLNDSNGYYFEHALLDTVKGAKCISYSPFFIQPQIEGISGSTGKIYTCQSHTLSFAIRYAKYAFHLRREFRNKVLLTKKI